MKSDVIKTIQRNDLGPSVPQEEWVDRLIDAMNRTAESVQSVLGALSLTDNVQCDVVTGRFTHGVRVVFPLKKLTIARSAIILQGASQGALFASVDSGGRDASGQWLARVTVWFANSTSQNVKATLLLLPEGPDSGTAAMGAGIDSGNLVASGVVADRLSLKNFDNLMPGSTSEDAPPPGSNLAAPEWAGRVNVGLGVAYAGSWVRELSAAQNSNMRLGDVPALPGTPVYESDLLFEMPCAPGDSFYMEAQCKMVVATNGEKSGVFMGFLDGAGNLLTPGPDAAYVERTAPATTWANVLSVRTAPAGTVKVKFFCWSNSQLGATTTQFDAIYIRRTVNGGQLGDGNAWFAKSWVAGGRVQWNHTAPGTNSVSWSAILNGTGQTFLRFDYNVPPASIGTGVTPLAFAQLKGVAGSHVHNGWEARVHTIDTTLRQVSFDLYDSAGTLVDLATVSFVVHINLFLFFPAFSGYTL